MKKSVKEISIADAVRKIVSTKKHLQECLADGLVNYTWAAQSILEEIKKITGREKVGIDAVKAALIRIEQDIQKEKRVMRENIACIMAKSTIELQDDISVVTLKKSSVEKNMEKVIELASNARFFNFTQGKKSYTFMISSEDYHAITNYFTEDDLLDALDKQSAITLISPPQIISTPGVMDYIASLMYRAGVNLTQVVSCYTDTVMIVDKKDSINAVRTLQESIAFNRRLCKRE